MGKKYIQSSKLVDHDEKYGMNEAFELLDKMEKAKFDETVDCSIRLGVDPKQSDQMVRGATPLPHGLGKEIKILVFAKGEKEKEAKDAGADFVGLDDFVEKINGGWFGFDKIIATPDVMGVVSKIGKVLGPRGLMPNPKTGTVTFDVARAVKENKAGKVEFRVDKAANLQAPIGKRSFGAAKLLDNFKTLYEAVLKAKPATAKGIYIKSVSISSTMSPGIKLDVNKLEV
jgi:large subunit ribosomal protein L1